ncbi:rho-related BTB domain-containing protein 3 isoform X3 [Gopherus flavomarginatus]|uniref:rho-related BTB domain-containing protein 3 isoform X3 n=1 Tax=Gopherus flavomarginatus TaxID=286002 RepID=UPI0021CBF946|nr:rho-related BTB domain-containing protein 3 isoform X3 [Gopherus flavomarginatus]
MAGSLKPNPMSVHVVAFGNERDGFSEDNQQSSLIWTYLGRSALISETESNLLLNSANHTGNPVFTEYQACVFGNVRLVVHDCPLWDIFDSDWYTSQNLIGGADIIVIKYSVNDKSSFQEVKDSYVPMIKRALNHCSIPVIISAVGARKSEVPCTCPLCTLDRGSCVTASEGIQLAKELGATYLELHSLSDFYIGKYFGGVLEYFMIQSLNQKSSEKMKRKESHKCHGVKPPQLEQPGAFQWELLEEDIKKKLKDPGEVELVLEKVKCILKTPGKVNSSKNCRSHQTARPLQLCDTSLRLFFNTHVLADVIFQIQGATVPAHRAVLVARCEVMAAMFNGSYIEANSFLVPVYGVSKDTFLSFLEYLYTDSCCPASILQAMSLLICAEMYQVSRLQHICELYIITQLQSMPSRELASTSLSVVSLLRKAKFHNSDCLSTWLLHFIATNYLIFSQKPEFQDLSAEERNFVEMHRWPSSMYLKQLADYRNYINSQKCHCIVM